MQVHKILLAFSYQGYQQLSNEGSYSSNGHFYEILETKLFSMCTLSFMVRPRVIIMDMDMDKERKRYEKSMVPRQSDFGLQYVRCGITS